MIEEWYNEHLACETEQKTNSLKNKLKKRVINSFTSRETTVYWGKLSEHQIKSVKQQGRKKKKKVLPFVFLHLSVLSKCQPNFLSPTHITKLTTS